jgi:hypothetical protein
LKTQNTGKFIKLIKKKPELGGQVETLILDTATDPPFDIAKFLVMLPNLKSIEFFIDILNDSDDSDNASDSRHITNSAVVSIFWPK